MVHPVAESHPSAQPAATDRADWYMVASLIGLWGLMEVLIDPVGDFPLNDDWAYGLPVKWLGPSLNASSGQVAIEELEIGHEGIKLMHSGGGLFGGF